MARANNGNYYTNPAFCQQSEFHNDEDQILWRTKISPRKNPIGAQTPYRDIDHLVHKEFELNNSYEEQDFYEEMEIDNTGIVKDTKIVIFSHSQNEDSKFLQPQQNLGITDDVTYLNSPDRVADEQSYDYFSMAKHISSTKENDVINFQESEYLRYNALIGIHEDMAATSKGRYSLVPIENTPSQNRMQQPNKPMTYSQNYHRYECIDDKEYDSVVYPDSHNSKSYSKYPVSKNILPMKIPIHRRGCSPQRTKNEYSQEYVRQRYSHSYKNLTPTQQLHEILSTPKKKPVMKSTSQYMSSPISQRSADHISRSTIYDPFITPQKVSSSRNLKAQQKLNYATGSRIMTPNSKKHTAIISPICSSSVKSVYSEEPYLDENNSWLNISAEKPRVRVTLAVAALMMVVCGGLSSGMCSYMTYLIGKVYYLEFGILSGFVCLTLGILGFRTRYCTWLPNRNFISGYIVLSIFSLLTCSALLILLFLQPRPGTPLADMTSGAVCTISVLSLCLATTGVVASYCCSIPPPDNRVQHCAQGFIV
ncbi:uncharacterized protein LOC123677069 [Harmonia axyridis]|uniref:uncharacterized protein LOC123677069 n=1 Tax=Harmonia axyridis TaxID=115357 RepID=UPI001E278A74|nr:uncharacterized protein LOC123677069 [Harmonia axyridis]